MKMFKWIKSLFKKTTVAPEKVREDFVAACAKIQDSDVVKEKKPRKKKNVKKEEA